VNTREKGEYATEFQYIMENNTFYYLKVALKKAVKLFYSLSCTVFNQSKNPRKIKK
jgi:hypothetical protein